ncbi:MAG: YHS domain-containing protein [Deltaproteobacteria bacterium]|nr:YHS domain-containing protein [Deltaproteobacteria bacterium]
MKKQSLILSGILSILMALSFCTLLPAEEGGMQGMKGHNMKGMMEKTMGKTVTDPVCGMKINPETAAGGKMEYEGKTYYFCGDADRKAFEQDPAKYIKKTKEDSHHGMKMKHEENKTDQEEHHEMEMEGNKSEGQEDHHMMGESHWMAPAEAAEKINPVKATKNSIAKGKTIFEQRCIICHGKDAKGTGALADSLNPKPADLTGWMVRMHPDGDIFYKISRGRGAMPAWKTTTSEEDRWNVINYIRSLNNEK